MTRAQRIALAAAAAVFVAVGAEAAVVTARDDGGSAAPARSSGQTTTTAMSSQTSPPPSTSTGPGPVTATAVAFGGAPVPGGWRTRMAITFDHPPAGVVVSASAAAFRVTFPAGYVIPQPVLDAAAGQATRYLMQPRWDRVSRVLTVDTPDLSNLITQTVHGVVGRTLYLDDVRPPAATRNGCLELTEPAPYTGVFGVFLARGTESAFEGQFRVVVRGGGTQTARIVHAAGGGPAPFAVTLTPPLESSPVLGTVVAFERSPKDGSPACVVRIPVWLSPGG